MIIIIIIIIITVIIIIIIIIANFLSSSANMMLIEIFQLSYDWLSKLRKFAIRFFYCYFHMQCWI